MKKILFLIPIIALLLTACDSTANNQESQSVNKQQQVYTDSQPVPFFDWSLERHLLIELYKARNNAVATYSYVRNYQGQIVFSCKSIGFPIASNTQLTNPEALANPYNYNVAPGENSTLPQAEPNGTYTSPSTSGTYVFCVNDDGTVSPSYFEAEVEAHVQRLNDSGNSVIGDSALKIKTTK